MLNNSDFDLINTEFVVKKNIKTIRSSNIELLRFIAAILVVFFHLSSIINIKGSWLVANLTFYAAAPVILFAFITGYFLMNTTKNRFFKFLPIMIFYLVIYLLIVSIVYYYESVLLHYQIKNFIRTIHGDWWYLWTIPLVYLLFPIVKFGIDHFDKRATFTTIMLVYLLYFGFTLGSLEYNFFGAKQLLFLMISCSFGAWWKKHEVFFVNKKTLIIYLLIAFLLVAAVVNNLLLLSYNFIIPFETTFPSALIVAFAFFFVFQQINMKYNKAINYLGAMTLPIYLFHYIFLAVVQTNLVPNLNINSSDLKILIVFFSVALPSIILAAVLVIINSYYNNLINYLLRKFRTRSKKTIKQ